MNFAMIYEQFIPCGHTHINNIDGKLITEMVEF